MWKCEVVCTPDDFVRRKMLALDVRASVYAYTPYTHINVVERERESPLIGKGQRKKEK